MVAHVHSLGLPIASLAAPWISSAFSGHLPMQEVLLLWDRVVGLDSLLPLPLLAVAIVCFRRQVRQLGGREGGGGGGEGRTRLGASKKAAPPYAPTPILSHALTPPRTHPSTHPPTHRSSSTAGAPERSERSCRRPRSCRQCRCCRRCSSRANRASRARPPRPHFYLELALSLFSPLLCNRPQAFSRGGAPFHDSFAWHIDICG